MAEVTSFVITHQLHPLGGAATQEGVDQLDNTRAVGAAVDEVSELDDSQVAGERAGVGVGTKHHEGLAKFIEVAADVSDESDPKHHNSCPGCATSVTTGGRSDDPVCGSPTLVRRVRNAPFWVPL